MSNFIIFRYLKKKKDSPLKKFIANYNWKYIFKSQKTNKEVPNALSLLKFLDLLIPSRLTYLSFGAN